MDDNYTVAFYYDANLSYFGRMLHVSWQYCVYKTLVFVVTNYRSLILSSPESLSSDVTRCKLETCIVLWMLEYSQRLLQNHQ